MATVTGTPRKIRSSSGSIIRWMVLILVGIYLLLPLAAMAEFSTRGRGSSRSLKSWAAIGTNTDLVNSIIVSLELSALTIVGMLVLLVPTMIWVDLRLPRLRQALDFICLLPLTVPAIVLVVGIAPIYAWVNFIFGDSPLTLTFIYVVLVLPYAYRAIDAGLRAIESKTLAEAARSLGASWAGVIVRIIVPNIRGAIISASVISVALVLGEFTIASLLNFDTLQVVIYLLGQRNAAVSIAVSLAALIFVFLVLLILASVGSRKHKADLEDNSHGVQVS